MISKKYSKYITIFLVLLIIFLAYLIIKPFITLILTSCILAYIFYPIYNKLKKIIKHETTSAFLVSILMLIIVFTASFFILINIQNEAVSFYSTTRNIMAEKNITIGCTNVSNNFICKSINLLQGSEVTKNLNLQNILGNFTNSIISKITQFLLSIPVIALHFVIIIFIMFYLFKDGDKLIKYVKNIINLEKNKKDKLIAKIKKVTDSIIFGNIIVALIQGTLGAIGFWILGLSSPILWGLIMALFSLIPFIGTAVVWVPGSIILIFLELDETGWIKGMILFLYGFLIIGGIDSLLKPILIGDQSKIHPIIILIGVLGGLTLFGAIGIIVGPLILGIGVTIIESIKGE